MAKKDDRVVLQNTNKTFAREVFSADGNSVSIMPGAKAPVDPKFLWNLPADVRPFKDTETVFSKGGKADPKVKDVTAKTGNTQNPEDSRTTVVTDAPVAKKQSV